MEDKLITKTEAAQMLGVDRQAKDPDRVITRMARRGDLQSRRVGRWVMILRSSVIDFIEGR